MKFSSVHPDIVDGENAIENFKLLVVAQFEKKNLITLVNSMYIILFFCVILWLNKMMDIIDRVSIGSV